MAGGFGYFYDARLCDRSPGITCPEKPQRLELLKPELIFADTMSKEEVHVETGPNRLDESILTLAHEAEYIQFVKEAHAKGRRYLDRQDTAATEDTFDQALLSASVAVSAVDKVLTGQLDRAFCAIRPPGHHANAMRAMGYCIFNNAAIAARYAQDRHGLDRVLIIDWDNDPGNGTQEIFWTDPSVFLLSFHQSDLFPAAGGRDLVGAGKGEGFNRNMPLPPGINRKDYFIAFETVLRQVLKSFKPQLLIISAGFDAHRNDPRSKMPLVEEDFATLTELVLRETAPHTGGKTVSLLEGGYNVATLQASVKTHCHVMTGCPVSA